MMLHHGKLETLQPIISSVGCLYEYSILYKYQITLIVFYSCLLSNNILKNIKKFGQKQIGMSSASFELEKCYDEP